MCWKKLKENPDPCSHLARFSPPPQTSEEERNGEGQKETKKRGKDRSLSFHSRHLFPVIVVVGSLSWSVLAEEFGLNHFFLPCSSNLFGLSWLWSSGGCWSHLAVLFVILSVVPWVGIWNYFAWKGIFLGFSAFHYFRASSSAKFSGLKPRNIAFCSGLGFPKNGFWASSYFRLECRFRIFLVPFPGHRNEGPLC